MCICLSIQLGDAIKAGSYDAEKVAHLKRRKRKQDSLKENGFGKMLKQLLLEIIVHFTLTINCDGRKIHEALKHQNSGHQTTKVIPCQWRLSVEALKMIKHDMLPRHLRIRQYFMEDSHRYMKRYMMS